MELRAVSARSCVRNCPNVAKMCVQMFSSARLSAVSRSLTRRGLGSVAPDAAVARGEDGDLVFTVANSGEWIEPATKKTVSTLGIGLENLRERLARHYPRAHALTFAHADGWVTVVLRISPRPTSS